MIFPKISALSESTINKIAAGEVIDRPAGVVKELVENSLDADAQKIVISLEDGGKEFIRVIDDGYGIQASDLGLAYARHATSKIEDAEDLFKISSLGFRGEALASIASVAQLELETKHVSQTIGYRVVVSDGIELERNEIARNTGTSITVRRLFLHTPVRRKFMNTARAETQKISAMVSRLALANPDVRFKLLEGDRVLLSLNKGSLKNRLGEILGFNLVNEMAPLEWSDGHLHIQGYVSPAHLARGKGSHQYFFVNGRSVFSPIVSRAWAEAYDSLPPGKRPVGAVFLTLPVEEVDVNVHPTKKEVRFLNDSQIFWGIQQAVRDGLRRQIAMPEMEFEPKSGTFSPNTFSPNSNFHSDESDASSEAAHHKTLPFSFQSGFSAVPVSQSTNKTQSDLFTGPARLSPAAQQGNQLDFNSSDIASVSYDSTRIQHMQLHNRYILFAVESGLTLVNQEAAHERVLFERCLEELRKPGRLSSQQLLFPEICEFPAQEAALLDENLPEIRALAFDLESFGRNTFQLRGIPMELNQDRAIRVLQDIAASLVDGKKSEEDFHRRLAKAYAKAAGVRAGEALDSMQVSNLIDNLFATQNPYVSPSGHAVVLRFPLDEINRRFGLKPEINT